MCSYGSLSGHKLAEFLAALAQEESIMSKTLTSVILSVGIAVACVVIFSQNIMIGLLVLLTIVLDPCRKPSQSDTIALASYISADSLELVPST